MTGTGAAYDNGYADENVYGHVVDLLSRYVTPDHDTERIHIDFGAGYGAIGPVVEARLGLRYVAFDADPAAVEALRARGTEAHVLDLLSPGFAERVLGLIGGRPVASMTLLDVVEHLPHGESVLALVGRLAQRENAVTVVSVPNVTHQDVGVKLALGSWTSTRTGLLDETHVRFFDEPGLEETLRRAGLHVVGRNDFHLPRSDQHFPEGHPALQRRTNLAEFFARRRNAAAPNSTVNQFVWSCLPGPVVQRAAPTEPDHPFLSVVIRTQGRREQELREVFSCLLGQTTQDFEVVVVGHDLSHASQLIVEGVIAECPPSLRDRTRLIRVDGGTRATLLNSGFAAAVGDYIVVLDDDDLVFAHWVEVFRTLSERHPGRVLRSRSSAQSADRSEIRGRIGVRALSGYTLAWEREFSFVTHLVSNHTPFMTAAFPRGIFRDLGERFDESLTTTEDWDYLLRAASLLGVVDSPEVTAVYRQWHAQETSATMHDADEWRLNMFEVHRKIDNQPVLLPAGETRRIRQLVSAQSQADAAGTRPYDQQHLLRALAILDSRSWRIMAPVRAVSRLTGVGAAPRPSELAVLPPHVLGRVVEQLESSRSWRFTRFFRRRG